MRASRGSSCPAHRLTQAQPPQLLDAAVEPGLQRLLLPPPRLHPLLWGRHWAVRAWNGHTDVWREGSTQVPSPATPQPPCLSFPPPEGEEKAAMTLLAAPMGAPAAPKQLCLPSPPGSTRGRSDSPGTPVSPTQQHPLVFQPPQGIQNHRPPPPAAPMGPPIPQGMHEFPQQHHGCFSPPGTCVTSLLGKGGGGTGGRFQSDSAIPSQTRLSQILSRAPPTTLGVPPQTQGKPPFLYPFISPKLSPSSSCVSPECPHVPKSSVLCLGRRGTFIRAPMGDRGTPKPPSPPTSLLTRVQHDPAVRVTCLPHAAPGPCGQQRGHSSSPRP